MYCKGGLSQSMDAIGPEVTDARGVSNVQGERAAEGYARVSG